MPTGPRPPRSSTDSVRSIPENLQSLAFQIQASVYVWARARTWLQAYKTNPGDTKARQAAVAELEACVNRLKPVLAVIGDANDILAQNARFRLAQALADLAEFGPDDPVNRESRNSEGPAGTQANRSTNRRFRAFRISLRLAPGSPSAVRSGEGRAALAAKAKPAVPEAELIEARLAVFLGMQDYPGALKAVETTRLSPGEKTAIRVRVRLHERILAPEGRERDAAETALFRELNEPSQARPGPRRTPPCSRWPRPSKNPVQHSAVRLGSPCRRGSGRG